MNGIVFAAILVIASVVNGKQPACQVTECRNGYESQYCVWQHYDCSTVPPYPTYPYDFNTNGGCVCRDGVLRCKRRAPCLTIPGSDPVCKETGCINGRKYQSCVWNPFDCSTFSANPTTPYDFTNAKCGCEDNVLACQRIAPCYIIG